MGEIFISHSYKDEKIAYAICVKLENYGISCWIAPRDIQPGEDWAEAISNAIKKSKVFLLVFSDSSNDSEQVQRELTLAANNHLMILPYKITNNHPKGNFEYYLSNTHWLNAVDRPQDESITQVKNIICSYLNSDKENDCTYKGEDNNGINSIENQNLRDNNNDIRQIKRTRKKERIKSFCRKVLSWPILAAMTSILIVAYFIYRANSNQEPPIGIVDQYEISIVKDKIKNNIEKIENEFRPEQIPIENDTFIVYCKIRDFLNTSLKLCTAWKSNEEFVRNLPYLYQTDLRADNVMQKLSARKSKLDSLMIRGLDILKVLDEHKHLDRSEYENFSEKNLSKYVSLLKQKADINKKYQMRCFEQYRSNATKNVYAVLEEQYNNPNYYELDDAYFSFLIDSYFIILATDSAYMSSRISNESRR